jgi:hypothetical protein
LDDFTHTVRVSRATRDHRNKVSTASAETVDATIQRGLDLLEPAAGDTSSPVSGQWCRTAELDS